MKNEFIPYEQALALKELGFDKPCFGLWNLNNGKHEVDIIGVCKYSKEFKYREVLAPTFSQAFRWFREKCGSNHFVEPDFDCIPIHYNAYVQCSLLYHGDNYEEAELACLKKLIEIQTKQNEIQNLSSQRQQL